MFIVKNDLYIDLSEEYIDQLQNKKLIYEVIRVIDGIPLFLKDHIIRLNNSLSILKEKKIKETDIEVILKKLIKSSGIMNGNIKIINDFLNNDIYAFYIHHKYPSKEEYLEGVKTILYFGERNNPNAKVMDINFRENVNKKIHEKGAYEAILINNTGNITEGSKSNIFLVKGENLYTSPAREVLPGITRQKIFTICNNYGINLIEEDVSYKDIDSFDGLFISGTSPQILPVKSVDLYTFDSSKNKLINSVSEYYDILVNEYLRKKVI